MLTYPIRFAKAIARDWIARMSGGASVLLAIIGAIGTVPSWAFWAAAVVCLIVAAYRVWLRECKEREKAEQENSRLLQQLDEKAKRKAFQEKLGVLLAEAQTLMGACSREHDPH